MVSIAVMLTVVAAAVPVTAGVSVGVESASRKEDSAVKIAVEITPDDTKNATFTTHRYG